MTERRLLFRVHALQRMFQRNIHEEDVRQVLAQGETIEDYPDDRPYPSRLVLGWSGARPLHIVAADIPSQPVTVIVTVYDPEPDRWDDGFRRRIRP